MQTVATMPFATTKNGYYFNNIQLLVYIHAKKLRRLLRLRSLDTKKNYIAMKTVTLNILEPHT